MSVLPAPIENNYQEIFKTIQRQNMFGFIVRNKSIQNRNVTQSIDNYLLDNHGINLPMLKSEYVKNCTDDFYCDESGAVAELTEVGELINFRYAIERTKGYYAMFDYQNIKVLSPLAFWYSKHKLCAVWNWRKSQIIRSRYLNFLKEAKDDFGRLLISHYKPIHLVLTVPHKNGFYKGSEFYSKELIEDFTAIRKTDVWKKYIYSGEYGLEVKKSKQNGLHIHIHSFLLQKPEYSVHEVRKEIVKLWKEQTGNYSTNSGLNYETLYAFKLDGKGERIKTKHTFDTSDGEEVVFKTEFEKDYIEPGDDIQKYLGGVLECIKYHFKPDCLEKVDGGHDIELIKCILNNTKGKRLYSRFGKFYGVSELNFNNLDKENLDVLETKASINKNIVEIKRLISDIEAFKGTKKLTNIEKRQISNWYIELANVSQYPKRFAKKQSKVAIMNYAKRLIESKLDLLESEAEPVLNTSTDGVEERLYNPNTYQKAVKSEYKICISSPLHLRYNFSDGKNKFQTTAYNETYLKIAPQNFTLKQVIKLDLQGFNIENKYLNPQEIEVRESKISKAHKGNYMPKKYEQTTKRDNFLRYYQPAPQRGSFADELAVMEMQRVELTLFYENKINSDLELQQYWQSLTNTN
jgi:hypothetical protein